MPTSTYFVGPADRRLLLGAMEAHRALGHSSPLSRLAAVASEATYNRGAVVVSDEPMDGVLVVVEGGMRQDRPGWPDVYAQSGDELGLVAALARDGTPLTVTAKHDSLALHISRRKLDEVLAGSFALTYGYLQYLAERLAGPMAGTTPRPVVPGAPPNAGTLDLAERIIALGATADLGTTALNALGELARHVVERRYEDGDILWSPETPGDEVLFLVHGTLLHGSAQGEVHRGRGSMVGLEEALVGGRRQTSLQARQPCVVLAVARDALFDVLEDHPLLARLVLARLARGLLAIPSAGEAGPPR